jgi:hypothetical protein
MLFNSLQFAVFFVVVTMLFSILPGRLRALMVLLANCYVYRYEDVLFCDTQYHLGREGRRRRTERLAGILRAAGILESPTASTGGSPGVRP